MAIKLRWDLDGNAYLGAIPFGKVSEKLIGLEGDYSAHFFLVKGNLEFFGTQLAAKQWVEDKADEWVNQAGLKVRRIDKDGAGTIIKHDFCRGCGTERRATERKGVITVAMETTAGTNLAGRFAELKVQPTLHGLATKN